MSRRTVFCVQAYRRVGGRLEPGALQQFTCATEAEAAGERLSAVSAGVIVYSVEGAANGEILGDPELFAAIGEVPRV